MKKEYLAIITTAFFILGYVLDILAGPVLIPLNSPFDFLKEQNLSSYPFTAVSILLKASCVVILSLLVLSFIDQKQLAKGGFLLFLVALLELYSIQQIATGGRISLPWSIALAFAGIALLVPTIIYFIIGLIRIFSRQITKDPYDHITKNTEEPDL